MRYGHFIIFSNICSFKLYLTLLNKNVVICGCGNGIKAVALRRSRRAVHRSGGRRDCVFQTCVAKFPVHKGIYNDGIQPTSIELKIHMTEHQ